jgi:hypothetical protein
MAEGVKQRRDHDFVDQATTVTIQQAREITVEHPDFSSPGGDINDDK